MRIETFSRRHLLLTGGMASASALFRRPMLAMEGRPSTRITFSVPTHACDCHVHVFGDPRRYPFNASRVYTPESASVAQLRTHLDALHLDRVVLVQPSVYGSDNDCLLDAMRQLGRRARAVCVISAQTPNASLDDMRRAGVRGVRLNLTQAGVSDPQVAVREFEAAAGRARERNWHLQINTSLIVINALRESLLQSSIPLVFDHFGGALGSGGVTQLGFDALLRLVRSGIAYVKISAAADLVSSRPDYTDVLPLATALLDANPRRILWGSNWPHPDARVLPSRRSTDIAPFLPTDDGKVLNLLATWVPDPMVRRLILVDNPGRLYGF